MNLELPVEVLVLSLVSGLIYALLGMGLVLVYKVSRFINFAHGEMGALASLLLPVLVIRHGWSYWPALGLALVVATAAGAVTQFWLVRPLARSSRLVVMVASIGAAQIFFAIGSWVSRGTTLTGSYPTPFDASWTIGDVRLGPGHLLILAVAPLLTAALVLFLHRTSLGIESRAAAENGDAAQLAGVPVHRIALVVWALAGLFAGVAAILIGPTKPLITQVAIGPSLMVRALAAAMLGGMDRLPAVFAGGIAIGVIEGFVLWNYPTSGLVEVVLFVLVVASLMLRRDLAATGRRGESSSWALVGGARRTLEAVVARSQLQAVRRTALAAAAGLAIVAPLPLDNSDRVLLTSMTIFALVGLSLVVLTGFAGQVSLGQFAFVGFGALVGGRLHQLDYPLLMGMLYAAAAGGLAALIVGLPALRIRGLFLAVTTLAFAVASQDWLRRQDWLVRAEGTETSLEIPRSELFGVDLQSELSYYWFVLVVVLLVMLVVHRLRTTGLGRSMMAVRDNEASAAALGISPRRTKLLAFILSGMIAGLAGHLYGGLLVTFSDSAAFGPELSLAVVAMVVVGGVTTITGAVVGAVWMRGLAHLIEPWLPAGLSPATVSLLVAGPGLVVVLLAAPGGLVSLLRRPYEAVVRRWAGVADDEVLDATAPADVPPPGVLGLLPAAPAGPDDPVDAVAPLVAEEVTVRFGGKTAVDAVSLHVGRGEIVGLVGPNGAGKTTLFDVLSGQQQADAGRILLDGHDITGLRPFERARRGLGRTFQQARLFDDLTVLETFEVALERDEPSETVPSLLGYPPSRRAERRKAETAGLLVDVLGLGRFSSQRVVELSTGTRRIVELGAVIALGAHVVLLDEPTAGLAQREAEAFPPVLRAVRDHLDASMVVIEHDVPLIMDLTDRIYVLAAGALIAEGPPDAIRDDPDVIAAYLGTDQRVIERSVALR